MSDNEANKHLLDAILGAGDLYEARAALREKLAPKAKPVRPFRAVKKPRKYIPSQSSLERYTRITKFIEDSITHRGKPPTNKEIAQFMGVSSVGTVGKTLKIMEREGFIEPAGGRHGTLQPVPNELVTKEEKEQLRTMKSRGLHIGDIIRAWRKL